MRLGAHAFAWVGDWADAPAERAIRGAAEGADFVEIPIVRPADVDVDRTRSLLATYGRETTCSLALPSEASLPERPHAARAFLGHALGTAHELGRQTLPGAVYGAQGYAVDWEEFHEGTVCLAAPVRSYRGRVVAAISVSLAKSRLEHAPWARRAGPGPSSSLRKHPVLWDTLRKPRVPMPVAKVIGCVGASAVLHSADTS